jgi:hypothetical protein
VEQMSLIDWWNRAGKKQAEERAEEKRQADTADAFMLGVETLLTDISDMRIKVIAVNNIPTFEIGNYTINIVYRVEE